MKNLNRPYRDEVRQPTAEQLIRWEDDGGNHTFYEKTFTVPNRTIFDWERNETTHQLVSLVEWALLKNL